MFTKARTHLDQEPTCAPARLLACEWGVGTWRLGCTTGAAQRPRERLGPAGEVEAARAEMGWAKQLSVGGIFAS